MPLGFLLPFCKPAQAPSFLPQRLYHPFASKSKIALVPPGLTPRQMLRRMKGCPALAAPVGELALLARAVERGEIDPLPPLNAVVVFTGAHFGELRDLERDLFWRVFEAPVFEQCIGLDGQVLAVECDAHQGLHVLSAGQHLPEGFTALPERAPCGCGRATPRWIGLRQKAPAAMDIALIRP